LDRCQGIGQSPQSIEGVCHFGIGRAEGVFKPVVGGIFTEEGGAEIAGLFQARQRLDVLSEIALSQRDVPDSRNPLGFERAPSRSDPEHVLDDLESLAIKLECLIGLPLGFVDLGEPEVILAQLDLALDIVGISLRQRLRDL
jgi:hypothetical protein